MKYGKRAYLWSSPPTAPSSSSSTPLQGGGGGGGEKREFLKAMEKVSQLEQTTPFTYPMARLKETMEKIMKRRDLPLDIRQRLYDPLRRQYETLFHRSRDEEVEVDDGPRPTLLLPLSSQPVQKKKKPPPKKKKEEEEEVPPEKEKDEEEEEVEKDIPQKGRRSARLAKKKNPQWIQVKFTRGY